MNIAVQINSEDYHNDFNYRLFSALGKINSDISVYFVSDKKNSDCIITAPDEKLFIIGPEIKNGITSRIWYDFKLRSFLKKNKIVVFFSSSVSCSLGSQSMQVIQIHDDNFTGKKNTFKHIKTADFVITSNEHVKRQLTEKFTEYKNKIIFLKPFADENITPLNTAQQEEVRSVFSDGKDYFLLVATDVENEKVITALKAFSIFKKWQHSGMKMLIVVKEKQKIVLAREIESYKYKTDVNMLTEDKIKVLCAAAYGIIFLSGSGRINNDMLSGMKYGVPLIVEKKDCFQSFFNDAVLYANANETELSQKMILLYKDEALRNSLVSDAYSLVASTSAEDSARVVLSSIIKPLMS